MISGKLRTLRFQACLTLDELALQAGISKSYLWELENGKSPRPSAKVLGALADALGVSLDYLIGRDEKPTRSQEDEAFYREYLRLPTRLKAQLLRIMRALK